MNAIFKCFVLFCILGITGNSKICAQGTENLDTLHMQVVDPVVNPVYGIHVVLIPENVLLATSDPTGKVQIPVKNLPDDARLQFQGIGYKKQIISLKRLKDMYLVVLKTENINLEEVVVKGAKTKTLLKDAQDQNKRSSRKFVDFFERYYGQAQYMKITECFGRAVEFRREYGCFLTTGNIKRKGDYSQPINQFEDLEREDYLQRRFVGNGIVNYDYQQFSDEVNKYSLMGSIFDENNREVLLKVFNVLLKDPAISQSYKKEIMKYLVYTDVFNKYDLQYDLSFVPVYSQRSLSLDGLAEDTLSIAYNKNFDAGSNKLFTIMRCIYLYAPVFSSSKNFNFQPSDKATDDCYAIDFVTDSKKYPRSTSMLCKGTLWLDRGTRRLKKMQLDFCYYHLYRLAKMSTAFPPFETSVVAEFDYDEDDVCYINSCKSITYWVNRDKEGEVKTIYPVESPSRVLPDEVQLREVEGFRIYSLNKIPTELQTQETGKTARAAARNPKGEYKQQVFDSLEFLWDCQKAVLEMNQYQPIQEQFQQNSGKSYYQVGGKYFNLKESEEAREKILNLFFYNKPQE